MKHDPKKNICFVISSPMTVKAFLRDHLIALSKIHSVHLIVNLNDDKFDMHLPEHITVSHLPIEREISIKNDVISFLKLVFILRKYEFFSVHSITPKAGLITMLASFACRTKNRIHIFTGQVWANEVGLRRWVLSTADKLIFVFATQVLVDGHSQRTYLLEQSIIREEKSSVLGAGSISGVNIDRFKPRELQRESWLKTQLGIDQSELLFMYLGRINKDKGILDLLDTLEKLHAEGYYMHLMIIGPSEDDLLNQKIELLSKKYSKYLFRLKETSEPEKYLSGGDVFCLPSYREGFGSSVLEAAACKLPTICSDIYGLHDTVVDGKTGLVHKVGDINSLGKCIKKMLDDPSLVNKLGDAARARVKSSFNAKSVTEKWVSFYNSF